VKEKTVTDARQNPEATPDTKRQHQTDESKGSVKGPQFTGAAMDDRQRDMPAGSAGDRRRAAKGAR
jgi:hypothetical protein